jgi:tetratricopeptide (TPR) repeat protein
MHFERAWHRAEPFFRRALELNPRLSIARVYYSLLLAAAYRHGEAWAQLAPALDVDPLSPWVYMASAFVRYLGRAYPEAERLAHRALDLQPDYLFALWGLERTLTHSRRLDEAIRFGERAVTLSRAPLFVGALGMAYGLMGRTDDLTRLEHELDERRSGGEFITPISYVQFAIGRVDGARIKHALEDCLAENTPFSAIRAFVGPVLDEWRVDGAINELLLRLGDGVQPPNVRQGA